MVDRGTDRRTVMVVGAVALAALMVVGAVAFMVGTQVANNQAGAGDERNAESEECAEGTSRHPRSMACVPDSTACTAWLDGSADRTVQCNADSQDGEALVALSLQGSGSAVVRVYDADGAVRHDQRYIFSDTRELDLSGMAGAWTLRVSFEDAMGSARITLWG